MATPSAIPFEAPPSSQDELVFAQPNQPSLIIPRDLVADLWAQANEGTRMLARRGLEIGGLLVGPKVSGGKVVVEGILPLPIGYQYGPAFHMSPTDLATIAPEIESVQSSDDSMAVVGFYRSRTRGDGTLRESDYEIVRAIEQVHNSFAENFRCCFVIAPLSESEASACVAMRYGGGWHDLQPFRLRSNPLSIVAEPLMAAPLEPVNLTEPPPIPERVPFDTYSASPMFASEGIPAEGVTAQPGWIKRFRTWLCAGAGLLLIIGFAAAYRGSLSKPAQAEPSVPTSTAAVPLSHLGFSATRDGPVWKLSWDPRAVEALNPVGASLSIEDGGYQQQVPLASADLASGTLFYTPQSSELTFSLRIDRGGSHVEEHVRVIEGPPLAPKQANAAATSSTAPGGPVSSKSWAERSRLQKIMAAHAAAAAARGSEFGGAENGETKSVPVSR